VAVGADPLAPADSGQGPIATALRDGRAVYSRDGGPGVPSVSGGSPEDGGPGASVCLPLLREGRSHAVLTLYAEDAAAFDDHTRRLLEDMARNVSFALDGFADTERLEELVAQRQELLSRLVTAQEAERERIAADLHQEAVPTLEVAGARLTQLTPGVRTRSPQLAPAFHEVREVLTGATEALRHLLFDLEAPHAELPLAAAIRETAEHVFFDGSVRWTVAADDVALPLGPSGQALRVLKEALINVRKHAHASHVEISVRAAGDGVEFRVADDGIGFDPDATPAPAGHRGLVTMRERAEMSGGWLRTGSTITGAEVAFWLPRSGGEGGW
jgi:signal transduction histidine kinase